MCIKKLGLEHLKSSKSCLCEPWPWRSISTSHTVPSATTQDYVSTVTVVGRNGQLKKFTAVVSAKRSAFLHDWRFQLSFLRLAAFLYISLLLFEKV